MSDTTNKLDLRDIPEGATHYAVTSKARKVFYLKSTGLAGYEIVASPQYSKEFAGRLFLPADCEITALPARADANLTRSLDRSKGPCGTTHIAKLHPEGTEVYVQAYGGEIYILESPHYVRSYWNRKITAADASFELVDSIILTAALCTSFVRADQLDAREPAVTTQAAGTPAGVDTDTATHADRTRTCTSLNLSDPPPDATHRADSRYKNPKFFVRLCDNGQYHVVASPQYGAAFTGLLLQRPSYEFTPLESRPFCGKLLLKNGIEMHWSQYAPTGAEAIRIVTAQHGEAVERCWGAASPIQPNDPEWRATALLDLNDRPNGATHRAIRNRDGVEFFSVIRDGRQYVVASPQYGAGYADALLAEHCFRFEPLPPAPKPATLLRFSTTPEALADLLAARLEVKQGTLAGYKDLLRRASAFLDLHVTELGRLDGGCADELGTAWAPADVLQLRDDVAAAADDKPPEPEAPRRECFSLLDLTQVPEGATAYCTTRLQPQQFFLKEAGKDYFEIVASPQYSAAYVGRAVWPSDCVFVGPLLMRAP